MLILILSIISQVLQLSDKSHQEQDDAIVDDDLLYDGSENTAGTKDGNTEVKVSKVYPEEPEENDDITRYGLKVACEVVEEFTSDEGWQEANSKGRSTKTPGRKFGRRLPVLAKLNVSNGKHSNFKDIIYRRDLISPEQKATPKTNSTELFPLKQSKAGCLSSGEDSVNVRAKAPVSKVPTSPATLTSLASKSVSYKEVALAPPGTILKPLLEKVEELNEEKTEIQIHNIPHEISKDEESSNNSVVEAIPKDVEIEGTNEKSTQMETTTPKLEEVSCSSDQVKPVETKGSKLSAAAEPFNPVSLSMPHPLNSVSVTSIYDVNVSQGMLAEPAITPVGARIPCGPRSPLYHRNNYSFRMKHGHSRYPTPSKERGKFGAPRMNPHAPEFVPGRAWQTNPGDAHCTTQTESDSAIETSRAEEERLDDKSNTEVKDGVSKKSFSGSEKLELARQILLSFIVKSVRHNMDPVGEPAVSEKNLEFSENSSDAIANDSAIIKILYGSEGKKDLVSQSCDVKQPKTADENKKKNGDGEGFIVVRKRRRNRQQFSNSVTGLYNQQSICASVR
jgi:protein TIF31